MAGELDVIREAEAEDLRRQQEGDKDVTRETGDGHSHLAVDSA
jgi:hypothetical protein